ncbi:MAG: alpha-L-rhamnosidase C-terminal domain-containing protein, partial [Clostridia bacterium]|nr:alpha-L-rhamnosidase C-terminal domain-containing protein [Clostridia bacterium]
LSEAGLSSLAYDLLLQQEFPSWLYSVNQGATTIWEHWDGIRPDGSFWSDAMNSFNHYAYGSIGAWMFRVMGGITPLLPGYQKIRIAPQIDHRISQVSAAIETSYGTVCSQWSIEGKEIHYSVTVPCNTAAELVFQNGTVHKIFSGTYHFSEQI